MTNSSRLVSFLPKALVLTATLASVFALQGAAFGQTTYPQAWDVLPQMTGSASAPVTITRGTAFTYALTQKDLDTLKLVEGGPAVQLDDPDCNVTCIEMNSMEPGYLITKRGISSDYVITYDVTGIAIDPWKENAEPGGEDGESTGTEQAVTPPVTITVYDIFRLINGIPTSQGFQIDPPQEVQQVVIIRK